MMVPEHVLAVEWPKLCKREGHRGRFPKNKSGRMDNRGGRKKSEINPCFRDAVEFIRKNGPSTCKEICCAIGKTQSHVSLSFRRYGYGILEVEKRRVGRALLFVWSLADADD